MFRNATRAGRRGATPERPSGREDPMSDGAFLLVVIALGFVILAYFHRRARNYRQRHPGRDNPVEWWLTGRSGRDRDDDSRR